MKKSQQRNREGKRPIEDVDPEGVKLYEKLVYPSREVREKLAKRLYGMLKSQIDKEKSRWNILDVGIGGGWLTTCLIRQLLRDEAKNPSHIKLVGIDTSAAMLNRFFELIEDNFVTEKVIDSVQVEPEKLPRFENGESEVVRFKIYASSCNGNKKIDVEVRKADNKQAVLNYQPDVEFDVCLSLFFLHHLDQRWSEGIEKISELVSQDSMVVLSEIGGDQASWSYSFDKVYDFHDLALNSPRLRYLKFIRSCTETFDEKGWHNYRVISAANIDPLDDSLHGYGFEIVTEKNELEEEAKAITEEYDVEFCLNDWLKAAGLGEVKRVFSMFPDNLDNPLKDGLKAELERHAKDENLTLDEIITAKDALTLRVFQRTRELPRVPSITKSAADDIREAFSELWEPTDENYNNWKRDLIAFMTFKVIKNPDAIFFLHWELAGDVQKADWYRKVPSISQGELGIKQLMLYFWLTRKFLGNFKVTQILFREMPGKAKISVHFMDDPSSPYVDIKLRRDGSVGEIRVNFPKKLVRDSFAEQCKDFLDGYKFPQLDTAERIPTLSEWCVFDSEELDNETVKDIPELIRNAQETEIFNQDLYDLVWKELRKVFSVLSELRSHRKWELGDETIQKIVKALAFDGLTGIDKIRHIPSRDSLELLDPEDDAQEPVEVAAGGVIVHCNENTEIDDNLLTDLLNLRNRAVYLQQFQDRAQDRARRDIIIQSLPAAIAAIVARNMDHLLGSHIETAIVYHMRDLRREIHKIASQTKGFESLPGPNSVAEGIYSDAYWPTTIHDFKDRELQARARIDEFVRGLEVDYSNYRLKRMDLIARFSTEWIPWGVGMSFFYQVVLPFLRNGILLHFLGHGERICLSEMDVQVFYPKNSCPDCANHTCDSHRVHICANVRGNGGRRKEEVKFYTLPLDICSDFQVGFEFPIHTHDLMNIRGGDIGAHAFHIFLENVLRNSAKHGKLGADPKIRLKIWAIQENTEQTLNALEFKPVRENFCDIVRENSSEFWFVVISSSADHKDSDSTTEALSQDIDTLLRKPLTTEKGKPDPEAWGMKEKKICSVYLAGEHSEKANSKEPNYLWAGTIAWSDRKRRLAYCIKIPKARFLLFIRSNGKAEERDGYDS